MQDRDPDELNPLPAAPADGPEPDAESEDFSFRTFTHDEDEAAPAVWSIPTEQKKAPALTIHIQSWATPIVGLAMLVVGLVGGYFLRTGSLPADSTAITTDPVATSQTAQQGGSPAEREQLMAALVPEVRHFKGDPDAPVTIIEFSDFQ